MPAAALVGPGAASVEGAARSGSRRIRRTGAFEGPLTEALARWCRSTYWRRWRWTPTALVTAARRGPLFRDVLDREPAGPDAWEELLRQYAAMQHALTPRPGDRVAGCPRRAGHRTARRLRPARPHLAASGGTGRSPGTVRPASRNGALNSRPWASRTPSTTRICTTASCSTPGPGRFTFFDWGDAVVSHPFCSLPVPARGPADDTGRTHRARCVTPTWNRGRGGRSTAELRRAVSLAVAAECPEPGRRLRQAGSPPRAAPPVPVAGRAPAACWNCSTSRPSRTDGADGPCAPLSVADARLRGWMRWSSRGRGLRRRPRRPRAAAGRVYAQLVGGPLDGLLLDVTDLTERERGGVSLATEIAVTARAAARSRPEAGRPPPLRLVGRPALTARRPPFFASFDWLPDQSADVGGAGLPA
ncbi:hypothetical protein LV779_09120 [Streptomyces thinghirensis]|nr:hypothetical protein [Streptomyces thinghirensis]